MNEKEIIELLNSEEVCLGNNEEVNKKLAGLCQNDKDTNKTEYRLLLKKLLLAGAYIQALLDSSNDAVCVIDGNENVMYWNKKAEALYGIRKSEIVGKNIRHYFSNLVVTKVKSGNSSVVEMYHEPHKGIYVLINSYPVKVGGQTIGSISVERNITDMIRLHYKLEKKSEEVDSLKRQINKGSEILGLFDQIYGHSQKLLNVKAKAQKAAQTNATILISGETGTGKEMFAKAIHSASQRRKQPYVAINCGAVPSSLFESELFGYESGSFTGAEKGGKEGKVELANGGTLVLDEISELRLDLQVKLLRVLEERVFYRVGGTTPIESNTRIIAITNQDVEKMVKNGLFREDLYYRLNIVPLYIPPLKERKSDIPELVYYFLSELAQTYDKNLIDISPEVMAIFLHYDWPGNVRELRNLLERIVVFANNESIKKEDLPEEILEILFNESYNDCAVLTKEKKDLESKLIKEALQEAGGNKRKAAESLGIPRSTLYYRMRKLGIKEI